MKRQEITVTIDHDGRATVTVSGTSRDRPVRRPQKD